MAKSMLSLFWLLLLVGPARGVRPSNNELAAKNLGDLASKENLGKCDMVRQLWERKKEEWPRIKAEWERKQQEGGNVQQGDPCVAAGCVFGCLDKGKCETGDGEIEYKAEVPSSMWDDPMHENGALELFCYDQVPCSSTGVLITKGTQSSNSGQISISAPQPPPEKEPPCGPREECAACEALSGHVEMDASTKRQCKENCCKACKLDAKEACDKDPGSCDKSTTTFDAKDVPNYLYNACKVRCKHDGFD